MNESLATLLFVFSPQAPPFLNETIDEALIRRLMEKDQANRVRHILGVDRFAHVVAHDLHQGGDFADRLKRVALAHDIGYAQDLRRTGFHPLDGAIFLAHRGEAPDVIHAVLHHTGAREEARRHPAAAPFYRHAPFTPGLLDDAITYCDLQTSPVGAHISREARLDDIKQRYGEHSDVWSAIGSQKENFDQIFGRVAKVLSHNSMS